MDSQFLVSWRRLRATPLYREVPHYSQDGSLCYTMLYTSAYERGIKKKGKLCCSGRHFYLSNFPHMGYLLVGNCPAATKAFTINFMLVHTNYFF